MLHGIFVVSFAIIVVIFVNVVAMYTFFADILIKSRTAWHFFQGRLCIPPCTVVTDSFHRNQSVRFLLCRLLFCSYFARGIFPNFVASRFLVPNFSFPGLLSKNWRKNNQSATSVLLFGNNTCLFCCFSEGCSAFCQGVFYPVHGSVSIHRHERG